MGQTGHSKKDAQNLIFKQFICNNCSVQHRRDLIIVPLMLQTIIIALMSNEGEVGMSGHVSFLY